MNGFIGEFLILIGAFIWNRTFAAFAATGVILSAVYMLWMFQRVNYGEVSNAKNRGLPDLTPREWALVVPTIAVAIVMGVFPGVFLRPMEPAVKRTMERVTGRSFAGEVAIPDARLAVRDDERINPPAAREPAPPADIKLNGEPRTANREPRSAKRMSHNND